MSATSYYSGPDQRTEERAIISGMACPRCSEPCHDPTTTRDKVNKRGWTPSTTGAAACMGTCGWDSRVSDYDSELQKRSRKGQR